MRHSTAKRSAGKRSDGFPLWKHPSGRWAKKIGKKCYYFGSIGADPDGTAALAEWLRVKDYRLAGLDPPPKEGPAVLTVGKLCNLFTETLKIKIGAGSMAPRAARDYRAVTDRLVKVLGPGRAIEGLKPSDFEGLLAKLPATWNVSSRGLFVGMARCVFNYAHNRDQQLIPKPVMFGSAFRVPGKKERKRLKAGRTPRDFAPAEILALVDEAAVPFKAALLLGINCGFGNTDISELPWTSINGEWVTFPRPKTLEERRGWLWPETREELEKIKVQGRKPADEADSWRVFITQSGRPWVRLDGNSWSDSIVAVMRSVCRRVGIVGHSFYDLRRTFRTVADEALDTPAINLVMGHADQSMGAVYRQHIADERVKRVCQHVRGWLFPSKPQF